MTQYFKNLPVMKPVHQGLRYLQRLSLAAIVAAYILPVLGISNSGYSICWSYNTFLIPCPGCGLTRSVVHFFHMEFEKAFYYNPFGIFISICFILLAISAFSWTLSDFFIKYKRAITWSSNTIFVLLFIGGVLRILVFLYAPEMLGEFGIVASEKTIYDLFK